ncbi:LysR family transcriptional regulator [Alicyclobacillus mengziensis]|uniref:LysR family transcriptional regulator n=1 Tax=Alicyclobacillus mengziensis TaxID=2931921 RepID=A0A9X7Z7E7_9BACL|nr:LysR family transcriptional regulator [Alicyclobacillus mengziensis]QSO47285.1 LysR family transcriptional regulator [Alicyclobacillus mengziensis]
MDRYLQTFVTVVEKCSFTRAAEELHLTQSAVSREVDTLEKRFGVKLIDRTNKFVQPTKAGEILYHQAKDILTQYEQTHRIIADLANEAAGSLSIGSGYTFGEYLLPRTIARFKASYPLITPKITIMNSKRIVQQVLQRQVDLGIVEGHLQPDDLEVRPFAKDEMTVIVPRSHHLALSHIEEVDIDDLMDETWILREPGSGTREVVDSVFTTLAAHPKSIMEFGSSQIIKESVEAGLGISMISKWVIQKELQYELLHSVRIKGHLITRDFSSIVLKSQFRWKTLDLFLNFLSAANFA